MSRVVLATFAAAGLLVWGACGGRGDAAAPQPSTPTSSTTIAVTPTTAVTATTATSATVDVRGLEADLADVDRSLGDVDAGSREAEAAITHGDD